MLINTKSFRQITKKFAETKKNTYICSVIKNKDEDMKHKYALIFENGDSIKKIEKSTNAILRNNYESITWLEENDAREKKNNQ